MGEGWLAQLHRQVERVSLSDCEFLAAGRAPPLLGEGSVYAAAAEDVAAGGDGHMGAPPLKGGSVLHAYRALDERLGRTGHIGSGSGLCWCGL